MKVEEARQGRRVRGGEKKDGEKEGKRKENVKGKNRGKEEEKEKVGKGE